MAKDNAQSEKRKKIIAVVLFLVMVIVVAYQFMAAPGTPKRSPVAEADRPEAAAPASSSPRAQQPPAPQAIPPSARRASDAAVPTDTTPLDLSLISTAAGTAQVGPRGNIFDYFKEPPPKPAPPAPPPPITVQYVQPQSVVAGTPRNVTLVVTAMKLPADPVILYNGMPRPTKRVNETQLSTDLAAGEYSSQGNFSIGVVSQSDPKYNSNTIPFIVQPSPEPQFKYIGRIGDVAIVEIPAKKEVVRYKRGDKVLTVWQIDSITDQAMEITHLQYQIKKRVVMQERPRS